MGNLLKCCVCNDSSDEDFRKPPNDENGHLNSANVNQVKQKPTFDPSDCYYKMEHKKRGLALIFNHETYLDFNLTRRHGTQTDREQLDKTFAALGFDVQIHDDLREADIRRTLVEVAEMDHSDHDCLVVIVLTHGDLEPYYDVDSGMMVNTLLSHDLMGYIHARDKRYPLQTLWRFFTNENCPSLKDKPRVFLIQACQGDKTDPGFRMKAKRSVTVEPDSISFEPVKVHPILPQTDFLVAYASLPGFYSFRNIENGSWFIQALCKELNERKHNYDLLKILTFATQTVAYDYQSRSYDPELDEKKQIPCVVSMLTKMIMFPKPQ